MLHRQLRPAAASSASSSCPRPTLGEQVSRRPSKRRLAHRSKYTEAKLRQVDAAVLEFPEIDYTYGTVNTGYANGQEPGEPVFSPSSRLRSANALRRRSSRSRFASALPRIPGITSLDQYSPAVRLRRRAEAAPAFPAGSRHGGSRPDLARADAAGQAGVALAWSTSTATSRPPSRSCRCACGATPPPTSASARRWSRSHSGPLFAGDETSLWRAPDGENYTVMLRLPLDDRTGVADLQRIWFTAGTEPNGLPRMVHIAQIADIVNDVGASQINRRDLNREVQITANVFRPLLGRGPAATSQKILADTALPPGYRFVFGGSTKDMNESVGYAGQALLLAVILIYLILASQFGSFLQPFAIMMSLPMSLIGVFLGLLIAGSTLNIFSAIGFIMLMGLVTKNAILLVDFFNPGARARHGR